MAESTSTSPRIVCGDPDERIQVYPVPTALPPNSPNPPYNWIAKLSTTKKNGDTYGGTGFKIQLPGVNYTAVVTAGHNLVNATKTSVTFPGQKPITSSDFYIAPAVEMMTTIMALFFSLGIAMMGLVGLLN